MCCSFPQIDQSMCNILHSAAANRSIYSHPTRIPQVFPGLMFGQRIASIHRIKREYKRMKVQRNDLGKTAGLLALYLLCHVVYAQSPRVETPGSSAIVSGGKATAISNASILPL